MSSLSKFIGRHSKPLPELDVAHPLIHELSAALRTLDAMPLTSKAEVASWYVASAGFQERLHSEWAGVYNSLPHELEHYLVDADIRAKDAGYANYQRKILAALLTPEDPIQSSQPAP